jgi:Protein of unknown function (DUF3149)
VSAQHEAILVEGLAACAVACRVARIGVLGLCLGHRPYGAAHSVHNASRLMQGKDPSLQRAPNADIATMECATHAPRDLFTTDLGLMSVAGIAFMLGMGVFFVRYFLRHMQEDADKAAAADRRWRPSSSSKESQCHWLPTPTAH